VSSGAWTAIGTIALAAVTVVAVITNIVITRQDRRRADRQLAEERRIAQEREQFAEAYAIQVTLVKGAPEGEGMDKAQELRVAVINHGGQTITRVEVQFSLDGVGTIGALRQTRLPVVSNVPVDVRAIPRFVESAEARLCTDRLTPWDTGIIAETDPIEVQRLTDPRVMVRWGTRWEQKRGDVRIIQDGEQWLP
jgi:hypothetical protein